MFEELQNFPIVPYDPRRNGKAARKKPAVLQVAKPKLKKFEACAAMVELREHIEKESKFTSEKLANPDTAPSMIDWYRKDCEKFARWLAAIEMAATGLTR